MMLDMKGLLSYVFVKLFHVLSEIGQVHVALACQCVVHGESGGQIMVGMTALGNLQVIPQQLFVVGVSTVLDDALCALHGALSTEVSHTLLGDDHVHVVLGVVLVAHEGYDARDESALGC